MNDLNAILDSSILTNVSMACKSKTQKTRSEAINTIANIVIKLAGEQEYSKLRQVFIKYEIETHLLISLRNDYNYPIN